MGAKLGVRANDLSSAEHARRAFEEAGLHTMELSVAPVSNTSHWHHFHSRFYIKAGHLTLLDIASNQTLECPVGSHVSVPARVLHTEQSESGYEIVLGTSVPPDQFGDPVDLLPEDLLPEDL